MQNAGRKKRQPGWDLTFSAPKSVSVLWSQADPEIRKFIQEAHDAAVKAALDYLQQTASFSRRGKAGEYQEFANLAVATFQHGTSRAQDPLLHTHCLVMNVTTRGDGTGTLVSKPLYRHKMTAGALYRAELAYRLERSLGVQCERTRTWFEIKGVSEALVKLFSKRREAIEAELGTRGLESASAAAFVALETRKVKEVVAPRKELFDLWAKEGRDHGFTADQVRALLGPPKTVDRTRAYSEAIREAVETIVQSQSHFSERELLRRVAEASAGRGLDAAYIADGVRHDLNNHPRFVKAGEYKEELHYTTPEILALEGKLLKTAERLAQANARPVKSRIVEAVLARRTATHSVLGESVRHHARQLVKTASGKPIERLDRGKLAAQAKRKLSPEQAEAVRFLTATPGRLKLMNGLAGTGKTSTLKVCREIWEKAGYEVIGATLAGKARKQLERGSGIQSLTLKTLELRMRPTLAYKIKHHGRQLLRAAVKKPTWKLKPLAINKKTVLVIDEAGMVGTAQMARIIEAVSRKGGKLVLVGDAGQLQAIEAGCPFRSLGTRFGCAALTQITRQKDEQDREVVYALARRDGQAAIMNLAARGLVAVEKSRDRAIQRLVDDWSDRHLSAPDQALIFCNTNREAADINRRCQAHRLVSGAVDSSRRLALNEYEVFVGDRVLFTKRDRSIGLENGETGTVVAINPRRQHVAVKLDDGERVIVSLKTYKHDHGEHRGESALRLGYAVTTHKGQGSDVDRAYLLMGGRMQDAEISYVQASRAREQVRVYTDEHEAGKELTNLARQMSTSRAKIMAHDILAHQEPKPPLEPSR